MDKFRFCAPCHFGLEKTLKFEAGKIGGEDISVTDGRVFFSGNAEVCARANIFMRTAERVYIVLGEFKAESFDALFEEIKKLPLSEYIEKTDAFPNNGHSLNSKLSSVPAIQKIIKKAMAVNLGKAYGLQTLPESGNVKKIRFSIMKDNCLLLLDTSGEGLHKRGYREKSNAAPIRETLAAGIIDIARVRENDVVLDPFCGSGTILIESALKALDIAPGINRTFAGESFSFLPKGVWKTAREEANSRVKKISDFRAFGFDVDPESVKLTLENARLAGVSDHIEAKPRDIKDFSFDKNCKIITNPPYGERLLEQAEARKIYEIMGKKLKNFPLYVITSDEEFESFFGRKCDKNRKLYNGMMKTRLYIFG